MRRRGREHRVAPQLIGDRSTESGARSSTSGSLLRDEELPANGERRPWREREERRPVVPVSITGPGAETDSTPTLSITLPPLCQGVESQVQDSYLAGEPVYHSAVQSDAFDASGPEPVQLIVKVLNMPSAKCGGPPGCSPAASASGVEPTGMKHTTAYSPGSRSTNAAVW